MFVRGTVQGVGFRWWARARALELGLTGHARNTADGRVEVVAQGRAGDVDRLEELLREEPTTTRRPATSRASSCSGAFRGTEPPASSSGERPRLARVSDVPEVPQVPAELARLRSSIDNIDAALVHLLAERFKCTQQVGQLKAEQHLPAADPAREERQIARLRALADQAGLDPVFAEAFLNFIIAEVIHHHERIANGDE